MNDIRKRFIFKKIFEAAERLDCEHYAHNRKQKHDQATMCPCEYKMDSYVCEAIKYLATQGIDVKLNDVIAQSQIDIN